MQPAQPDLATEDEYLDRERKSETKHEYVNGEVIAMAGASRKHNLIAMNIAGALRELLRGKPCLVFPSDQRVSVRKTKLYTYPDITVVCGPTEGHPRDRETIVNPLVLIEVLSDSTEAYDRGAKSAHYRKLPSLKEYVLVAQNERRVEHYRRSEGGEWVLTEREGEGLIPMPALGVELSLAEIYAKVELLEEPA
ncbi:MAG: Uma2 family endonuclease [Myxococcales bacterium]|nr:Uma2 family endonuclease [Myxococcales bacterium]